MEETPEKLDWVTRRADCELDAAFQKLAVDVEEDVGIFNSRFTLESPQAIVFRKRAEYPMFSVHRRLPAGTVKVVFSLKSDRIEIEDECGVQALSVIPFLADSGRCKFQVGGEEIEQWQLRRKALEAILFKPTPR